MLLSLLYEKNTPDSFIFSLWSLIFKDVEPNADGERLLVEAHNPYIISWTISSYCTPSNPPSEEEYHVLVKKGNYK